MASKELRGRKVKELAEMSRLWDADDMIRNFDEEMSRLEQGLGHMICDSDDRLITTWLRPLPVTPRFDVTENDKELKLTVKLPNISKDKVRMKVQKDKVELFACSDDEMCRPHYIAIDAQGVLDPESAKAKMNRGVFEVKISKARKKKLDIK